MIHPKQQMLIIELNEFCPKYLAENAEKLNLENIKKVLNLNHSFTISPEKKTVPNLPFSWCLVPPSQPTTVHKFLTQLFGKLPGAVLKK